MTELGRGGALRTAEAQAAPQPEDDRTAKPLRQDELTFLVRRLL